jgi:anti-sigma factor RsiW
VADHIGHHVDHDPLLVAALLDGDIPPSERAAGEGLVRECPDCAALHADLIALSSATHALPTQARPRDFRLTAADASRLGAPAAGEPGASTPRLTGEMTATNTASVHASHDTMLVASLADHSLAATEREAAEALIASCGLCAALHVDLLALRAATRAMPTPTRPRDYTLTPDDAAHLHPSGWRRLVAAFGTSRDAFSRPLAVGLTTLGLAGLLVATGPSLLMQGSATNGSPVQGGAARATTPPLDVTVAAPEFASAPAAAGAPSVTSVDAGASPRPVPVSTDPDRFGAEAGRPSGAPVQGLVGGGSSKGTDPGSGLTNDVTPTGAEGMFDLGGAAGIPPLTVVSGVLLIVGLGLFLMRWVARRFGD